MIYHCTECDHEWQTPDWDILDNQECQDVDWAVCKWCWESKGRAVKGVPVDKLDYRTHINAYSSKGGSA